MDNEANPNQNNNYDESSRSAIKIIFILSIILLMVDLFSLYTTFETTIKYSHTYPPLIFNNCFKYQSIAEAFYSSFGSFAAISACLLSFGLMADLDYFIGKLLETFVYYNYCIFGPYLLASCFLGGYYFDKIAYLCDENLSEEKHLHFTMVLSLLFAFVVSVSLTILYAMLVSTSLLYNSIRFQREGNVFIGKMFWFFIQNRVARSFNMAINYNDTNAQGNNNSNGNGEVEAIDISENEIRPPRNVDEYERNVD